MKPPRGILSSPLEAVKFQSFSPRGVIAQSNRLPWSGINRRRYIMKRTGLILFSILAVLGSFSFAHGQIPKEGAQSYLIGYSTTYKIVAMGQERFQMAYEVLGVIISDTSECILQNASLRCVGSFHAIKGAYDDDSGFCVCTRPDGDQIFTSYKSSGKLGAIGKGTVTYVGGTGKFTGIQGGGEFTRMTVRPAAEGTSQGFNRVKDHYKLP